MLIGQITSFLETIAPPTLQEDYDNAGLLTGNVDMLCTAVLICLDCTEAEVQEAIDRKCNLIVAHHPIVFKGLKKINGINYVERTIIKAIKNDIAIFAVHTNLDNVLNGVNGKIAQKLGLQDVQILSPKKELLQKLTVFSPKENAEQLKDALFAAGAGDIGNYSQCSFTSQGTGTFLPSEKANPKKGEIGLRDTSEEVKIEVIFPVWLQAKILQAMKQNHPYEEVAHDIFNLQNSFQAVGSGVVGNLPKDMSEPEFLSFLANTFNVKLIKHTAFTGKILKKVAVCGGAGSFLINTAKQSKADVYVTSDVKYHEFFDADNQLLLADIGHYESEQFTIGLLFEFLSNKFPNFAVLKTGLNSNPVQYFVP
jgi:dinuclear metal center YbgI/SA1388 family protein